MQTTRLSVGAFSKDYCIRSLKTFFLVLTILAYHVGHSKSTAKGIRDQASQATPPGS